jgi:DNA mismatch endonuclease, patch repair protein
MSRWLSAMDIVTSEKRSEMMSKVKNRGNKSTEQAFLSLLEIYKIKGWTQQHDIIGTPDFAFPKIKLAIFIDGSFWHGGPESRLPKTNTKFWANKIDKNRKRDRKVNRTLRQEGWSVLRIWDKELKKSPHRCMIRLKRLLTLCKKN